MEKKNLHCLNCFRRDKDLLKSLEGDFDSRKVFVGFITDSGIIAVSVSEDITWKDGLVISDTIREMTKCP